MAEINLDQVWISIIIVVIGNCIWIALQHHRRKIIKSSATQTSLNLNSSATQTSHTATHCAQTQTMRFTERLKNYGDRNVDSSEIFDNCCDFCEKNAEKEAVGFCQECEKFMCLNCCKHHEKITLYDFHVLIGKENFKRAKENKTLFEKDAFPIQSYNSRYCKCTEDKCKPKPQSNCECHCRQPLGLACDIPDLTTRIGCFIHEKRLLMLCQLLFTWKSPSSVKIKALTISDISLFVGAPKDFCTVKLHTPDFHSLFFTMPSENKVYEYNGKEKNGDSFGEFMNTFFYTDGQCYGIASFNKGLAISVYIPTRYSLPEWQVQLTDFNGTVVKRICYDHKGQAMFKEPKHLTSNEAQDVLYVSDHKNQAVIAIDTNGIILFIFTHQTIKSPLGLTCDEEGNIYVACGDKVIQINQNGTKSRIILSSNKQETDQIVDVCFQKYSNMLGILNKSAEVTILKFSDNHW